MARDLAVSSVSFHHDFPDDGILGFVAAKLARFVGIDDKMVQRDGRWYYKVGRYRVAPLVRFVDPPDSVALIRHSKFLDGACIVRRRAGACAQDKGED